MGEQKAKQTTKVTKIIEGHEKAHSVFMGMNRALLVALVVVLGAPFAFAQTPLTMKALDEAIRKDPNNARVYVERCAALATAGREAPALRDCERAIQINPNVAEAYALRARLRAKTGDADAALQDFAQALRLRPAAAVTFDVLKHRGILRMTRGEFALAERDFEEATKLLPKRADVLYARGRARRAMGAAVPGDIDIAAAQTLQPDVAEQLKREGLQ